MALVVRDRVKQFSVTAGTGTLTLGATPNGFQSFSTIGDGNTTYYTIVNGNTGDFEVGIGTYTLSGDTLSRDTVLASSNSGNLVNFNADSKDVFVVYPAERAVFTDVVQTLTNKTISGANNTLSNIPNSATTATSANTNSTIVARDASGNFSAGTITAALSGNATTSSSTTGNAATATALQNARTIGGVSFDGTANINLPGVNTAGNQNTTGTAANVTGTVAIANGGTGGTTAQAARNNIAAAVTNGQYLRGNGTNVLMSAIQAADVPTLNQNTTGTAANITGTAAVANGGTGRTTLTANNVLLGNGTTAVNFVAPGTSGNVLTSNGTTWTSGAAPGLPAGSVIYVAMNTAPTGFLKANGAAVSRTTYADLFAAIGTTFGAGDGSTTFNVPDIRGEFMRGWDDGRGIDSGRAFGSFQAGAISSHDHFTARNVNVANATSSNLNTTDAVSWGTGASGLFEGYNLRRTAGAANVGPTSTAGGAENRPRNRALLACIKF